MSGALSRDIPKGTAAVIVALALVAGVVGGRESPPASPAPSPAPRGSVPAAVAAAHAPIDEIDLKRLSRLRGGHEMQDLFAPPEPPGPAVALARQPAVKPEPPPAPSAPPLPFTYLGRMKKGEQVTVYLLRNQDLLLAQAWSAIDDYRVEAISDSAVQFLYLPLGTHQLLPIPAGQ